MKHNIEIVQDLTNQSINRILSQNLCMVDQKSEKKSREIIESSSIR
jgi:predicted transcriptional regulator